jgi:inorganic pyrophosphatase
MSNSNLFHIIKQDKAPQVISVLVEIAKGDYTKYEFNHEYGILELDRVLYGPLFYPVAYCDVPGTWNNGDNDPLDAVVYCSGNLLPGTLVKGRVIGVMEMEDNGEADSKIICVADKDPRYKHVNSINDLTEYEKKDLKSFMELYKIPQTGKDTVKVGEFKDAEAAYELIENCIKTYHEKFGNQ